jgi:biopolymer transport protein ExbB
MAVLVGNAFVELFLKGGPIMWPILVVAMGLFAVVVERAVFWSRLARRRDAAGLARVLDAMERKDFDEAARLAQASADPVMKVVHAGLTHRSGSMTGALQTAAGVELRRAGRFMVVIDTCITMAPLFGLLGTVTGIMESFEKVTGDLAVEGVSRGIGEALIATAAGLAIAIGGVFFLNLFNEFLAALQFDMETSASHVEVLAVDRRAEKPASHA